MAERERIRNAEQQEFEFRLESLANKRKLQRDDEATELKSRSSFLFQMYLRAFRAGSLDEVADISEKLESLRQRLASTSSGVAFLIGLLESLRATAEREGVLTDGDECLLKACCGFQSDKTDRCIRINRLNKRESEKWPKKAAQSGTPTNEVSSEPSPATGRPEPANPEQEDAKASNNAMGRDQDSTQQGAAPEDDGPPRLTKEDYCFLLAETIVTVIEELRVRRLELVIIESGDAQRAKSLATIDAGIFDRFSRAETAAERRLYRALGALSMMQGQDVSTLLPDPRTKPVK